MKRNLLRLMIVFAILASMALPIWADIDTDSPSPASFGYPGMPGGSGIQCYGVPSTHGTVIGGFNLIYSSCQYGGVGPYQECVIYVSPSNTWEFMGCTPR